MELIKQVEEALENKSTWQYVLFPNSPEWLRQLVDEVKRLEQGTAGIERIVEEQRQTIVGLLETAQKLRTERDTLQAALEEIRDIEYFGDKCKSGSGLVADKALQSLSKE